MTKLNAIIALGMFGTSSGCVEYGYTEVRTTDTFKQVRRTTVDIVMVIDNSGSMVEEQEKLAQNFNAFIGTFEDADVDWQMGVLTSSSANGGRGTLEGGADELILKGETGRIIDTVTWDSSWGIEPGVSMQLSHRHALDGTLPSEQAWCAGTVDYGAGDRGNPGAANGTCGVTTADLNVAECMGKELGSAMGDAVATGTLETATTDFMDCVYYDSPDAPYTFTAPHTGCFEMDTAGSEATNVVLELFENCDGACSVYDIGNAERPATVRLYMSEGQSVSVVLGSAREPTGEYQLNINDCDHTETAAIEPTNGQLVISEFMADPESVSDDQGEWVELTSASTSPLQLMGVTLSDNGTNSFTITDDIVLLPFEQVVIGRSADATSNGGVAVDVATGPAMTLNNNVRILTHATPGPAEIFAEIAAVGTGGGGQETSLQAAFDALSDPLINETNAGLLRTDASLALIFVSDEDDVSFMPASHYLDFFLRLKGEEAYRDAGALSISAVTGISDPTGSAVSCESDDGKAAYGARYVELAQRTGGVLQSICEDDFSSIAEDLGLTASGLIVEFALSKFADPESMNVSLYEDDKQDALLAELTQGDDYTFVPERNAIRFELEQVPPSETWLVVNYRAFPGGARMSEEEQ